MIPGTKSSPSDPVPRRGTLVKGTVSADAYKHEGVRGGPSLDGLVLVEDFEEKLSHVGEDDVNDSGMKDKDELHDKVDNEEFDKLSGKVTECTADKGDGGVVKGDG